jgi:HK97 family phage major capsid protein
MNPITRNDGTVDTLELLALGEMLPEYDGPRLAMEVMRRHGTKEDLMQRIMERSRSTPLARAADGLLGYDSNRDAAGYSISRAIRAAMERDWSKAGLERDVSNLGATRSSTVPNGFFLPLGVAARDFNAGTASQAGNLIGAARADDPLTADPLRRISTLASMGATFLSGLSSTLTLPRFASATTAAWKSEIAGATAIIESTAANELTPKRLACTMVVSRQAILQATVALDVSITRHLIAAIMEQLEHGAFNGDGASDSPVGIRSTSGITNIAGGVDGALITYPLLADLENGPSAANAPETQFAGYIVNPATRRYLRTVARGTNLPFIWDNSDLPLLGHRAAITGLLPSNLSKGSSGAVCSSLLYSNDWSSLVIGLYGPGLDILVDRVTLADVGQLRITASLLVGVGTTKPAAFAKMDDAKTA